MTSAIDEELQLYRVDQREQEKFWVEIVRQHHYLSYNQTLETSKYLTLLGNIIVGAISFSHASLPSCAKR